MADFFDKQEDNKMESQDQPNEDGKIKVGDQVYEQAELERLVGLGKIGAEAEDKFKTKIDRVWPEYTKSRQEIEALKAQLAERQQAEIAQKQAKGEELDPEQLREVAKKQAKELGLIMQEDFDQMYVQRRAAEKLVEETQTVIDQAIEKGQPKTSKEDLLRHMQETGIRNPEKAYKDMFESEIEKWKEEQTKKATMPGLFSTPGSTAGGKNPSDVKITKDNLQDLLHEALSGGVE